MKSISRYHILIAVVALLISILTKGCTTSPSGAFEHSTTIYYLDDKFHEDIPEDYIFKVWGYRIIDALGREHTYKTKVDIPHQRKGTKLCTIHRQSEVIKAHFNPTEDGYYYWVNKHPRSL